MDDLNVLEPTTRTVTFGGQPRVVHPLRVGQIPSFARAIKPIFAALAGSLKPAPLGQEDAGGGEFDISLEQLFDLIAEHGENLIEIVAIATKIDKATVEDADTGDFVSLLRAVLEVNADFFGQAVARARAGAGLSLSSS